jgi:hypothetical protein
LMIDDCPKYAEQPAFPCCPAISSLTTAASSDA